MPISKETNPKLTVDSSESAKDNTTGNFFNNFAKKNLWNSDFHHKAFYQELRSPKNVLYTEIGLL